MGSLKTFSRALALIVALPALPNLASATTLPISAHEQLRFFATCAGRLSAEMEHQWLFDGAASERTEATRQTVIDVLDAMMPPERGREVLNLRIEAKMAHAALLTRATFNQDPHDARWAARVAARNSAACEAVLLG